MKIIFVCTGNTCRSPMAEGYLKSLNIGGLEVASRGLQAGGGVSENSVAAMQEIGIDISAHTPRNLTREEIDGADIIVCMTATHKAILESAGVKADIRVLGSGISDPF
ncbi:MAG: low molecular weight phosphatase family protein, partial [Clostridia bacterium]|nr:low molecular weight phosphatase family protein [Clostridia bacterium]